MLIDIALVVAAAVEDAVPVAAMSIVVDVPMSMCDMSISAKDVFRTEKKLEWSKIGRLAVRNECQQGVL